MVSEAVKAEIGPGGGGGGGAGSVVGAGSGIGVELGVGDELDAVGDGVGFDNVGVGLPAGIGPSPRVSSKINAISTASSR
ncbi:MAG: hypothetical protein LH471_09690, partial [Salinibacterium sp.]|nr:hypothetical protein [Salinibacterium sp.]